MARRKTFVSNIKRVSLSVPEEMDLSINKIYKEMNFSTRSEFIRSCIRNFIENVGKEEQDSGAVILKVPYEERERISKIKSAIMKDSVIASIEIPVDNKKFLLSVTLVKKEINKISNALRDRIDSRSEVKYAYVSFS